MAMVEELVGAPLPGNQVIVERSAVERFAGAVLDDNIVYFDAVAAHDAGFPSIPAPPTFPSVMAWWGSFRELQEPGPRKHPGVEAFQRKRAEQGGMILHGEEEYIYHRTVCVGDQLTSQGRIVEVYERESGGRVMTFCVSEVVWTDAHTGDPVVTTRSTLIHRAGRRASDGSEQRTS